MLPACRSPRFSWRCEDVSLSCSVGGVSAAHAPLSVSAEVEDGVSGPDAALMQGRLRNSESLKHLHSLQRHLTDFQQTGLTNVINSYLCLFSDTPTQTHLMEHDINVGDAQPISPRLYLVNHQKAYLSTRSCHLGCGTHLQHSNV